MLVGHELVGAKVELGLDLHRRRAAEHTQRRPVRASRCS
jgi:hypothetical protein